MSFLKIMNYKRSHYYNWELIEMKNCHVLSFVQRTLTTAYQSYSMWEVEWNSKASYPRKETKVWRGKVTCSLLVSEPGQGPECSVPDLPASPLHHASEPEISKCFSCLAGTKELCSSKEETWCPPSPLLLCIIILPGLPSRLQICSHYPCPAWKWVSHFII